MQITRYGQSALLIEDDATRILIDPGELSGDDVFELDDLDALLVTHDHPDHFAPTRVANMLARHPGVSILAPRAVLGALDAIGGYHSRAIEDGDQHAIGSAQLEVIGELHQLIHERVPRSVNVGFVITAANGLRLFHPGDSYENVPESVDVLALPILGPWGSLREAIDFADAVAPRRMFPIHDVHLSDPGRDLFWSWAQKFTTTPIDGFDPSLGVECPLS